MPAEPRPIFLGTHKWPVLEVPVTQRQARQLDRLWYLCSLGGARTISDPQGVKMLQEGQRAILGFDWQDEFRKHYPDSAPAFTVSVDAAGAGEP